MVRAGDRPTVGRRVAAGAIAGSMPLHLGLVMGTLVGSPAFTQVAAGD